MAIWKDLNGGLHDDMDGAALALPSWPQGMTQLTVDQLVVVQAPTLALAQTAQLATLAADFATASVANVTDDNGVTWSGGMSSALSIYGAVQLAAASGATSVTLFDAGNLPHVVTIAQGTAVAAAIGAAYQTVFAKYQGYKAAVAAATTVKAVQAIVWQ